MGVSGLGTSLIHQMVRRETATSPRIFLPKRATASRRMIPPALFTLIRETDEEAKMTHRWALRTIALGLAAVAIFVTGWAVATWIPWPFVLWDFLGKIPPVVWSGLGASALTVGGVLLANWDNTRRLRMQHAHDASESAKERLAVLRRDVYLTAAEEMTKATAHLASLPRLDPTKDDLSAGMQGFLRAANKVQVVCSPGTVSKVINLVGTYNELYLTLLMRAKPIHDLNAEYSYWDESYNEAQANATRILDQMQLFNESARTDNQVFNALQVSFDVTRSTAQQYARERESRTERKNALHLAFVQTLRAEIRRLMEAQLPVLAAIRGELELDEHSAQLLASMENQLARMNSKMDEFLGGLEISNGESAAPDTKQ